MMEMESEELIVKSCILTTSQTETLNSGTIRNYLSKESDQMQSEYSPVQTKENTFNLTSSEASPKSSLIATASDFQNLLQITDDETSSWENKTDPVTSEEKENSIMISTEPRIPEDSESTDSFSCHNWLTMPRQICTATEEYHPTKLYENFTKGCQWAPDGTCLLVPSEDFRIRIYELPKELYSGKIPPDFMQTNFKSALTVKEGGLIYDSCWYPYMDSWKPITCCFLSTSQESPVHLWDAFTGALRATYRPYNQIDEVEAAISVQFVNSGKEIWCGFKNAIRMFNTDVPGRQTNTVEFKTDFPNMKGLVSCIRENPVMPGLVALGTYSKCIGLYKDEPVCIFRTGSGVTQIEFSPCGMKLFSAVRRNSEFLCWDLRNPGTVLYSFAKRQSDTNQRIQFGFTSDNKQIISGGTDGSITVWELLEDTDYDEDLIPKYRIQLSKDCINGISLHKKLPIIATSSGQRQCGINNNNRDNSVRLWWT